jgi:hypothetical protein
MEVRFAIKQRLCGRLAETVQDSLPEWRPLAEWCGEPVRSSSALSFAEEESMERLRNGIGDGGLRRRGVGQLDNQVGVVRKSPVPKDTKRSDKREQHRVDNDVVIA